MVRPMGVALRAATVVTLLMSFPMILLLLLAGLVTVEVLVIGHSTSVAGKLLFLTAPTGFVLVKGLVTLLAKIDGQAVGTPLTETAQPRLWALVRQLADLTGTRPPDEIYLTAEANAGVMEETRLLGLVALRRRMFIGTPLLAGLREDQFAAVLTHELAHYSNRDTRLSGLVYRGRRAMMRTVSGLNRSDWFQSLLARLLVGQLKLYLRASTSMCRRQELAADEAAARAAGSTAAAGALREIAVIDKSWDAFTDRHLMMGWRFGYLPADVFGGFAEFQASVTDQLDRIRRNPPTDATPYDTHPPIGTRVAAIEAMAATPLVELDQRAATTLLDDPATVLDAGLMSGLVPQAQSKRRVDWATLTAMHGRAAAAIRAAAALDTVSTAIGRRQTLRTLLDTVDAGGLPELAGAMENMPDGERQRTRREFARQVMYEALATEVQLALVDAGAARYVPSWQSGAELTIDEPYATELPLLLAAAHADPPDTAGLRTLLKRIQASLDGPTPSSTTAAATHGAPSDAGPAGPHLASGMA